MPKYPNPFLKTFEKQLKASTPMFMRNLSNSTQSKAKKAGMMADDPYTRALSKGSRKSVLRVMKSVMDLPVKLMVPRAYFPPKKRK